MRAVLTGGGTGGHIYPALAMARHIMREDPQSEILYIGAKRGLEGQIVPQAGFRFESIEVTGFKRSVSIENIKTAIRFWKGVRKSRALLRQFRPDVVIGTGGYVCAPVVYAASRMNIPAVIHEQNAIPGLANVFLSRFADLVAVSFEETLSLFPRAKKTVYTGNPCATSVMHADKLAGWTSLGLEEGTPLVLVVGGSGGARSLNEAMVEMAGLVGELPEVHFVFVTGNRYYENTEKRIGAQFRERPSNLHVFAYLHNMPDLLAATGLIVTRSGASIIAEITALGIPSIQIPSPHVTNNHQEANARQLAEAGAAEIIFEHELSGKRLFRKIRQIMTNPFLLESMANNARKLGHRQAADELYKAILGLIRPSA